MRQVLFHVTSQENVEMQAYVCVTPKILVGILLCSKLNNPELFGILRINY